MKIRRRLYTAAIAATLLTGAAAPSYHVSGSISAPDGGWDYARVDDAAHKLYIARGSNVTEVDLAHANSIRAIGKIAHGHAVVPISTQNILLVTSGQDNSVRLLNAATGEQLAVIPVGTDPDAALFDPASKLAAVMNAKDGTVSVIDLAKRRVVRSIKLRPGLEYAQIDRAGTLFVNNEDADEIDTADVHTGAAGTSIALSGCTGPSGLALDAKSGILISACANNKAAIVNARTKRLIKLIDIGARPDAVILDEQRRLAFIPCGGDGTLSIISLDAAGGPKVMATVKTAIGARTGALDASTGRLYLPTADFGAAPAGGGRRPVLPGTFRVLVVSPS